MSHDATNWAIKQRGLKPAAKVVLWHLCDRYHPDHGCFPSLDTLADDCEMSRRSVQDQIEALIEAGLVSVEKMPRQRGQLPRNRYRFAFENSDAHLGQNLPKAEFALGKNDRPPLANSDAHLGQNLPTNPVKGTNKGTSKKAHDPAVLGILCEVISPDIAEGFMDLRRKKRAFMTDFSARLIVKDLTHHPNPDAVVEASIKNGWTGVFPEKIGGPRDQSPRYSRETAASDALARRLDAAARTH